LHYCYELTKIYSGFKPQNPQGNFFIIWYVTAIAVSSRWEVLTFRGTHLIKRISLLSLIIRKFSSRHTRSAQLTEFLVGEGIIALSKSIATITEQEESLTAPLIGIIISAVVIIVCHSL
jgi:hypothetical protein